MAADNDSWVKPLIDFAKKQPFPGGFLIGAISSALLSYFIAKNLGFKSYENVVKEWKNLNSALKREIGELKQQILEKDQRLRLCHKEIEKFKGLPEKGVPS